MERVQVAVEVELVEKRLGRRTPVRDQQLLLLLREVELRGGDVRRVDRDRAHARGVRDEAGVPGLLRGVEDVEAEADRPRLDVLERRQAAAEPAPVLQREAERRPGGGRPVTDGSTSKSQTGKF